eukprot:9484329-Pyramimonas_sp.AAC.1
MTREISTAERRAGEEAELAAAGVPQGLPEDDRAKRMRHQLPPGMEAFAALLDNKFAEQNAANEKTFKSTLKQVITEEVGPVRETVYVVQKELTRQGEELKQLQAPVKHLQNHHSSSRSESGLSVDSESSTRVGSGNMGPPQSRPPVRQLTSRSEGGEMGTQT